MKTTLTLITAVALLLIGCQSNTVTPAKSKRAMQAQQHDRIQKESDGSYSVIIKGKVKYSELKYAAPKSDSHEVVMLDKHNKKRIVKANLYNVPILVCGSNSGVVFKYKAVQEHQQIEIYLDILKNPGEKDRRNIHIASIPKSKADRVFFNNNRAHFAEDSSNGCGSIRRVYYQKGSKYGILGEVTYAWRTKTYGLKQKHTKPSYDALHVENCLIKVRRGGRVGYLGHTDIKYKSIGVFRDRLARFTLPDGRSGYVTDGSKREFYD